MRYWADYEDPKLNRSAEDKKGPVLKIGREITGKVAEVAPGGLLIVNESNSGNQSRIFLSSVKFPK